jgi:hypothetical protein
MAALLAVIVMALPGAAQRQAKPASDAPAVTAARLPDGGIVPDVALDGRGVLHLVYGSGMDAWYAQSGDYGRTFGAPVRLNTRLGTVTVGGERGPKIAIGKDGVIHVAWQGHYQKGGGVWVTRSVDGGKTFAPERNVLDKTVGIDEPTIAADAQGNVFVVWLDGRLPQTPDNKVASPIFMARSTDNGATFGANEALKMDFPGRACSCCMIWARVVGPELYVAYRTGYNDIRNMHFLRGPKTANDFHDTLVSADNWKLDGCPMSGPRFTVLPTVAIGRTGSDLNLPRRLVVAWMSQGRVYWTRSEDGGQTFCARIPAPDGGSGNYPMILPNGKGRYLLLWTRDGQARWAVYGDAPEGFSSVLASGTAGEVTGRPSAFVRPDGGFVIVR